MSTAVETPAAETDPRIARRNALAVRNLGLVGHIAKQYRDSPADRDDLFGEGCLALVVACETDDAVAARRTTEYLANAIRWAMLDEVNRAHFRHERGHPDQGIFPDRQERSDEAARRHEREAATKAQVGRLLRMLPPRERLVVRLVFGLCGDRPMQQNDLAHELGLTHARVWKLLSTALRRMELAAHGIDPARCGHPGARKDAPRRDPVGGHPRGGSGARP
jgi:RNA polymerase sporulation-specific sigma factor